MTNQDSLYYLQNGDAVTLYQDYTRLLEALDALRKGEGLLPGGRVIIGCVDCSGDFDRIIKHVRALNSFLV